MRIRSKQMDEFRVLAEEQANLRLVDYLYTRFPEACGRSTHEQLLNFVRAQRLQARQYGIEREDNLANFLDFSAMYGVDFPEQAWARDVMKSSLHGPDKMVVLCARVEETGVVLNASR